MATTPFLMIATRRFRAEPVAAGGDREAPHSDGASALIVGYGRFGQAVGQVLHASGISVTLIDTDVETIDVAGTFGAKVYFGDGTRIDMLRQAGAAEAEMILFCLDGDHLDAAMLAAVHEAFPRASVYVRVFDRRAMIKLRGAPVSLLVRETFESAIAMARAALDNAGLNNEAITRAETLFRTRDTERLARQLETGDPRTAIDRILTGPEPQVAEGEPG
jgi:CPA2 family monovalent cation:H+ antiporter-2/glutathione-regulated potassium-efflux system protein KefB